MTASHRSHAGRAIVGLAVVGVGLAWLWLRFNGTPPERGSLFPHDLLYYFHPALEEMGRRFAAGELPLWSPDGCAGRPLLAAMQPAVFYPPHWLSAWVPAATLMQWLALGHALLAGAGAALCLRRFGTPDPLAGALGIVFVYSCILGQSFWPAEAAVLAWWPLVLLCADHALDEDRVGAWAIGLAATTAIQLLAGFPQLTFYGAAMIALWVAGRSFGRHRRGDTRALPSLARVVGVALLGAGIAGAQLGASAELLSDSNRSGSFDASEVHYLQNNARAATIAARTMDPTPALRSFELPNGAPGYLGTGTLVLAGLALWLRRRSAHSWCLAAAAGAALLLADGHLGVAAPVYRALSEIAGLGHFRAPERLLFVAFSCWIGLAGLGAAAWGEALRARRGGDEGPARQAAVAIALLCGGVALAGPPGAFARVLAVAVVGIAPLVAPGSLKLRGRLASVAPLLAALLVVLDVGLATLPTGSFRSLPTDWASEPHVAGARVLEERDLERLREVAPARAELISDDPTLLLRPIGTPLPGGFERLGCYETLLGAGWPALSDALGRRDYKSAQASNIDLARHESVYAMASVGLVAELRVESRQALKRDRKRHARDFQKGEPLRDGRPQGTQLVWHRVDALPRAYRIDRYEVIPSLDETLSRIAQGPFDPHSEVLLDAAPDIPMVDLDVPDPSLSRALSRAQTMKIVAREPEHVTLEVDGQTPAIVVLTDSIAPGWRARIDGEDTPLLRANALFRAVAVPAGHHRVRFDYEPQGLRAGSAVSAASLLALAFLAVRGRLSRR